MIHDHDGIGVLDRREPVSDDECCASVHQPVHAALYKFLGTGVNGTGRFIENQYRGIGQGGSGNGEQLALSLGQSTAVTRQHRVIAVLQMPDEVVCVCQSGSPDHFLMGSVRLSVLDVLFNGSGEQVRVLQYQAEGAAQVILLDELYVDSVIGDLTVLDIIEAGNQVDHRCLAGTGSADEGQLLSRFSIEINVIQYLFLRYIGEIDIVEPYIAGQAYKPFGAVRMRVLPGPDSGLFLGFHQFSVLFNGIDQGNLSFICFRCFVHQGEDPLGACHSHDDGVELLGNLGDRHIEGTVQGKEGGQLSERQVHMAAQDEPGTDNGTQNIGDVTEVAGYRTHDVGISVGFVAALPQMVIQICKAFNRFVFIVEYFDDPGTFRQFFDVGVLRGQSILADHEVLAGQAHDPAQYNLQQSDHTDGEHRQLR